MPEVIRASDPPSKAMSVLYFVAHPVWPLTSGNRLRDYHLARQLAARASVTLVELLNYGEQPSNPPSDCGFDRIISLNKGPSYTLGKILRGIAGPTPLTILNYSEPRLASQLVSTLASGRFDAVQIQGAHLSAYLPVIRAAPRRPAILVDWHNIESELMWRYSENAPNLPRKLVARRTAGLLEKVELRLLESCGAHTVTSEREGEKLLARFPTAKVHVMPNGVDVEYFRQPELVKACQSDGSPACKQSLLFIGSMDYYPNIDAVRWFAHDIWPCIARKHPKLEFIIAGRNPSNDVLTLQSDRVRVTGTVADVRPFYASALAMIVPLRIGSGTRLKILEAMAAGVPIVSTQLGCEGLDVQCGVHLLLADGPSEITEAINHLICSGETRSRLAQAARALVIDQYDWAILGAKLRRIYNDLVQTPR